MFVLNYAEVRAIEVNGAVDSAAAVFHDKQPRRPYVLGIKTGNLGVPDGATENGIELGLGRNKRLFRGSLRTWRILLVAGCNRQQSACRGGAGPKEFANALGKFPPEKGFEQANLISK